MPNNLKEYTEIEKTEIQEYLNGLVKYQKFLISLCEQYMDQIDKLAKEISEYKNRLTMYDTATVKKDVTA